MSHAVPAHDATPAVLEAIHGLHPLYKFLACGDALAKGPQGRSEVRSLDPDLGKAPDLCVDRGSCSGRVILRLEERHEQKVLCERDATGQQSRVHASGQLNVLCGPPKTSRGPHTWPTPACIKLIRPTCACPATALTHLPPATLPQ